MGRLMFFQENHEYLIRIFARNEVGLSEPLESEEPYRVLKPTGKWRIILILKIPFSISLHLLYYFKESKKILTWRKL